MKTFIQLDWSLLDKEFSSVEEALFYLDPNYYSKYNHLMINLEWFTCHLIKTEHKKQQVTLYITTWEPEED